MIPTEIVDHVLSFLHSAQDYTTLETCSDIFPQLVDRHLYSHIGFTPSTALFPSRISFNKGAYVINPTTFSSIIVDRPHIANYVRVVVIRLPEYPDSTLPELSSILPILLHIESISLSVTDGILNWNAPIPKFCMAFRNCIRLPSIKEVAITNIDGFSLDAFHDCENLENLTLYGRFSGGEGTPTSPFPQLSSLSINATSVVTWMKSMKSNTLHTLCLRMAYVGEDLPKFRPLIEACSNTLVRLELDLVHFDCELSVLST